MRPIALVTGGHGFVGRNVARLLAHTGWQVFGIGHGCWTNNQAQQYGFHAWRTSDISLQSLRDLEIVPELIVHCAGSGSVGFSFSHPLQDFQRNAVSTAHLLEFARSISPLAAIVLCSSAAVYGMATKLPIKEDSLCLPVSPYGLHKKMAEGLCQSFSSMHGLKTARVRLFSVYGPELRKQLMWDACTKLTNADGHFHGTGNELRDWIHVEDAARLLITAGQHSSSSSPVFNGGTGAGVPVCDVLSALANELATMTPVVFSGSRRTGDPVAYEADISAALKLGWAPSILWHDGVREYVQWYKKCA